MKVSFPLSLKISLWLLANLLLLGGVGVGFLLAHGGLGWNALMGGPAGDRVQGVGDIVIGEINAAAPDARGAILARFGGAYGAEFLLFYNRGEQIAGPQLALPAAVRAQLVLPALRGGPPRPRDFGGPPAVQRPPPADGPPAAQPPPPADGPPRSEPPQLAEARGRGRFIVNEAGYWIGLRVPFHAAAGEPPLPATLLAHVTSRWALLRLLDIQPWLLAAAAVLVVSVLFWLPLVHGITRALGQLTLATGQIAEGRFDTRVPASRRDELGRLGESVNAMAGRLDTLVNGQKRFLGDIAHELGSPIGRLQVATEILESRADAALQPQIADVREEVQQMSALVGELLAFTKAGLRPRTAELATVELASLVGAMLAREAATARVSVNVPAGLAARADAPLLSRSLGNLVRNALRYAGDAAPIQLSARRDGENIVITVEDDGPGVPAEALARLGEPFYRPETARTRETGGVGLRLAIVRSGIAACGGEVRFENRTPHGFRAALQLAAG